MLIVPAKHFTKGRTRRIRLVVVHCTVSKDWGDGAEAVANYFKAGTRRASAHRTVDSNSIVQSVADKDTAYAAAGANSDGLHLELVGMPDQTTEQWLDTYGRSMLPLAAAQVSEWCELYDLERRWLTVAEVADGKTTGICTHHDVSQAFPKVSTGHWDPGPNFPRDYFMRMVTGYSPAPVPTPPIERYQTVDSATDSGGVLHTVTVGADGAIYKTTGDAPGGPLERIGAAAVSATVGFIRGTAGGERAVIQAHGVDGRLYWTEWTPQGWTPWVVHPTAVLG